MKSSSGFVLLALAAVFAACASPQTRIRKNQALFDALPKEQQAAVLAGRAEPGMTPEAVQLALGSPDRAYHRTTSDGKQQDVWVYGRLETSPGVGMVAVPWGWETVWGGGVLVGAGDSSRYEENGRVTFENGKAVSVDRRVR